MDELGNDEFEEHLAVDFQISCNDDSYIAFTTLGALGVIIYPLGIPALTLVVLARNKADMYQHDSAGRRRYEFLVADYKDEFFCEVHDCFAKVLIET